MSSRLILLLAALCLAGGFALAPAAFAGDRETEDVPKRTSGSFERALASAAQRSAAQRLGVASTYFPETTWVGRRAGQTGNYWEIGVGPARPDVDSDGLWDWATPIHGDSLQGWWPIRQMHTNASGSVRTDVNRPWWAIEIGNQANYVINEGRDLADPSAPGNRTFGVVGVWHSDPGNTGAGAGKGVSWTPIAGARSAWMGLRRHGDVTATDPITLNAFNSDVMTFNVVGGALSGTTKKYPGYGSQMDQMLYKDINVDANPSTGVTISFQYQTEMSPSANTVAATRTGWFEGDPLGVPAIDDGNFISAEAGSPAGTLAPVDSFQVYIGAPAETTVAGAAHFIASNGTLRPIYDPLRRWFNEVLRKGKRRWLFSKAGATTGVQTATVSITGAEKAALRSPDGHLRLVLRVHTNRGFDDESVDYSSNGKGAAQVDAITADLGDGPQPIGDFEGTNAALDIDNLDPASWHSTGKPPAVYFHVHDVATLDWDDLCGPPGNSYSHCDMKGVVISMGDHDQGEAAGGGYGTTEMNGNWAIVSPTINLVTNGPSTPNGWDITGDMLNGLSNLIMSYDLYHSIFDLFMFGDFWQIGFQSYPVLQSDGTPTWSEIRPGGIIYDPEVECVRYTDDGSAAGLIFTSNSSGIPDSVRFMFRKVQQCYRFGTIDCTAIAGAYMDNAAFGLVRGPTRPFSVDSWDWFQDTFPFSEDTTLVGTAGFDTTSALIRTGRNIAPISTSDRFDVPGDSVVVTAAGASLRLDMVFRIRPGPGSYVTFANTSSGLRRLPTGTAAATPGDGSFFGAYEADPGAHASPGAVAQHAAAPGGWDPLVWNSARCDTAEMNFFPVSGRSFDNIYGSASWMSAYHESDSHYAVLGVPRNRCFVVDTLGTLGEPNMTCGGVAPAWLLSLPPSQTGWDGSVATIEGTQILPDGLFTPGTHVEYFFRREDLSGPSAGAVTLLPDTSVVYPQPLERSLDAHRWQQFSVLPDRWKGISTLFPQCMLVVDWADGHGDELAWVSIADTTGWLWPSAGRHNGWAPHPPGADLNDPAYFVNRNEGPGTTWDFYQVRGADDPTMAAGSPGSRYSKQDVSPSNKVHGKYSKQGPTIQMLNAYYKTLLVLTGDLPRPIVGPTFYRSQDDTRLLREHLARSTGAQPRGLIGVGRNLASDLEYAYLPQYELVEDYLGTEVIADSYVEYTGNRTPLLDLTAPDDIYGLRNPCDASFDVLSPVQGAVAHSTYPPYGPFTPNVAGVHFQGAALKNWESLVVGFGIQDVVSRYGMNTAGRWQYFYSILCTMAARCIGCSVDDVPGGDKVVADFIGLAGNPMRSGHTTVRFSLAKSGRAEIRIYDIAGRMVRTLADRVFPAGEHALTWDGADDRGRALPRGVYFTRARWGSTGFEDVKRIVVLR